MARLESVSLGGYYPTPPAVIPQIASLMSLVGEPSKQEYYLDPCAGDGAALLDVIKALHGDGTRKPSVYCIELEKTRHAALKLKIHNELDWHSSNNALHGDAFRVSWEMRKGISLLWLNPPYDIDPVHGRLEEKFLERFAPTLCSQGILVFLVPFYALKASAKSLATLFEQVSCYRFPETEFASYKQVALLASKRAEALLSPEPEILAQILAWSEDASSIPELPTKGKGEYQIPGVDRYNDGLTSWKVTSCDFKNLLARVRPWSQTDRSGKSTPIQGIIPDGALDNLLVRQYPIAMPPRPAHIAAGIAAGIFNGARIEPDKNKSLPPILVKGVFDKEFRTVDEKTDKDGNVKALVQVQQPKLVTTVLDLTQSKYVTIQSSAARSKTEKIENMTMADLLAAYGQGLMDVMLRQCPVMHDPSRPEDDIELPKLARPLYEAQRHAAIGAVKLLGGRKASKRERRYKAAFVLGEIGAGKSGTSLCVADAIGAESVLIMCPPHLLTSWQDQISAVTPWREAFVLSDIGDVDNFAKLKSNGKAKAAILSRESAKLGHSYIGLSHCSKCGKPSPEDPDTTAKKRLHCEAVWAIPKGEIGHMLEAVALDLLHVYPKDARVRQVLMNHARVLTAAEKWGSKHEEMWTRLMARGNFRRVVMALAEAEEFDALEIFLTSCPDLILDVIDVLQAKQSDSYTKKDFIRKALLLLPPSKTLYEVVERLRAAEDVEGSARAYYSSPWSKWTEYHDFLWNKGKDSYVWEYTSISRKGGELTFNKLAVGDRKVALDGLLRLAKQHYKASPVCGEPLFQAIPEPRRYPVADYIAKKYPHLFDLFIGDECQEYASENSAQSKACHAITGLGIPTLLLSGTIMNGYASSLFVNMWATSADFRNEFAKDEMTRFVDRYGYRKRLVEDKDKESGKVVAYGSMSDRVETSERLIGNAPGVLPLFILKYLLPISVTLHKADLTVDIPKCTELVESIASTNDILSEYNRLQDALLRSIKTDRFDPERAGKLWGAMAEMPSFLDLATDDVGNTDEGAYEIRYPDSVGGELVARFEGLPASTLLPKEEWLIEHVNSAINEGRNVLVFAWHTKLIPRLARLIETHVGAKCQILSPEKVPTKKRETWINQEVIKKNIRVLIANPLTVQTGLNNLVYFSDEVWFENPACNPIIYRQAVGRVDRIGQTKETRIFFPVYLDTTQEDLHSLLLQKVAVSMSTDGLDAESALAAAGVGDDGGFSTFAVGRQLYELLVNRTARAA